MKTTMQSFYVNVPNSDIAFFKEFVRKMGWSISNHPMQVEVIKKEENTDIPADIMSLVGIACSKSEEIK